MKQRAPGELRLVNAIGSVGRPDARKRVYESFKAQGYSFATVIHPSAVIASDARLGEGAQVMAGAVIQPSCSIGENTIVNTRASVDHDCELGDYVHIGPGATLAGSVTVGDCTLIGVGASVIPGLIIGAESIVGAGAVIIRDVPSNTTVVGNPARRLGE